jgi:hypothetical protein
MTLRIDENTASGIVKSLMGGQDASGNTVTVVASGDGLPVLRTDNGKFEKDPFSADLTGYGSPIDVRTGTSDKYAIATTEEGHIIVARSGRTGYGFSLGDTVQVIMKPKADGTAHTPSEVHDVLKRVGIKDPSYTGDDGWKAQAAELLVRTYDKVSKSNLQDPLATRLARVAGNHGLTVNDVEPYFDSVGRMRFRLTEEAWDKVKAANPELANSGTYIVKTMNNYSDESNVIRMIQSGGVLSKAEQVNGGFGAFGGYAAGGSGHGASAEADLASGGGLGVFMSPFTSTGQHQSASHWGSRGTEVVFDGEEMLRDIGWWAHGPTDGPYGVLNPDNTHINGVGSDDDPLKTMADKRTFEFLPDSSADLGKIKAVILKSGNSSQRREMLIKHYKDQGIDDINGIPVEDFFVATPTQAKLALPKFKGKSMNGFTVASQKEVDNPPVINPGEKLVPDYVLKGYSSDLSYFPDGKLTKTTQLKTAMARARKYSLADPAGSYYIFRDAKGNYRVASNKGKKRVDYYVEEAFTHRFKAGQQAASLIEEDLV